MCAISPVLAQTIRDVYPNGEEWLVKLPERLAGWQAQWEISLSTPFPNLSYNYVVPGTRPEATDGFTDVVLKAGPPSPAFRRELAALRCYDGQGAVRLLDADPGYGAMLLERVLPGASLLEEPDDNIATGMAAKVMRTLWNRQSQPGPQQDKDFPTVAEWAAALKRLRPRSSDGAGPLPEYLVAKAERLFDELLSSQAEPVLLHGDLHHENILAAQSADGLRWLAIDPKGVWGEPAYETGAWLRNPMSRLQTWAHPHAILKRRIDQFADELELDRERIAAWGFAQAVLSAAWSLEDHPASESGAISRNDGWRRALSVAEWLNPLTP